MSCFFGFSTWEGAVSVDRSSAPSARQQRSRGVRWLGAGTLEPDVLGVGARCATSSLSDHRRVT